MTSTRLLTTTIILVLTIFLNSQRASEGGNTALLSAKSWVATALQTVILPSHKDFAAAAKNMTSSVTKLCAEPGFEILEVARERFAELVVSWSNVELYRFGPARINNLHSRLFFWPDRRNRGLRQVKRLIAAQDVSAVHFTGLKQKSVATQGLPALEFLLFGHGSETLAHDAGDYRCRYARAVARVTDDHAATLLASWTANNGHANAMTTAGLGNPEYQTPEEAVHELLRAATAQLEILRDLKLTSMLGETPMNTKPNRAPFALSGHALAAMDGNINSVLSLFAGTDTLVITALIPSGDAASLRFELGQVRSVLTRLDADPRKWENLLKAAEVQEQLRYINYPLDGAIQILQQDYASALGMAFSFNAMDGD